jgi:aerotaxis receptor
MTSNQVVLAGEVPFGLDELFFSRTDEAGRILFGNNVFQRVSGYPWEGLLNQPHKLVRHPDMPRGVFWLLWDTIKQGKPIGAYVKNRAQDGRHYWVFAIVTPIEGGYLSVRLKPSSALFDAVKDLYPHFVAAERAQNLSPADSAALIGRQLNEAGFADYAAFMACALGDELAARDKALERRCESTLPTFARLSRDANSLLGHAEIIASAYLGNANVPFNFRILAAQLGQEGAAISVISSNYGVLSAEMQTIFEAFTTSARDVFNAINRGFFLASTASVQRELVSVFSGEAAEGPLPHEPEIALLKHQEREYDSRARQALLAIAQAVKGFHQSCLDMKRLSAGLEVMRIMGKVECARHVSQQDRMDELLRTLEAFQKSVSDALKQIDMINQSVQREAAMLLARAA